MKKQVDKSHYKFKKYINKLRWASIWHQIDELVTLNPQRVLEIGPGPGVLKAVMRQLEIGFETLDIDPELKPDHLASVFDMPFEDAEYDVVCAFQVLEHLPFEMAIQAFREMARVASKAVVISLPNSAKCWPFSIYVPFLGVRQFLIPRPRMRLAAPTHHFDGEHFFEINKAGYSLKDVTNALLSEGNVHLTKTYRVHENNYHQFFIFDKNDPSKKN